MTPRLDHFQTIQNYNASEIISALVTISQRCATMLSLGLLRSSCGWMTTDALSEVIGSLVRPIAYYRQLTMEIMHNER